MLTPILTDDFQVIIEVFGEPETIRPLGDEEDHYDTVSYGPRVHGGTYATQRALLQQGKVYAAFKLDVADARRIAAQQGDPLRYEGAIQQATAYAECLRKYGLIT